MNENAKKWGEWRLTEKYDAMIADLLADLLRNRRSAIEMEDQGVIRSSESGRRWGISVDKVVGVEALSITELCPESQDNEGKAG